MDESVIRSCILFLSLASPDPAKVFPAAEYVIDSLRRKKAKYSDQSLGSLMVQQASKFLRPESWQRIPPQSSHRLESTSHASLIERIKELRSRVKASDYEAFLWFECVRLPAAEIAEGLRISQGTLKYRAYRGLKTWSELG